MAKSRSNPTTHTSSPTSPPKRPPTTKRQFGLKRPFIRVIVTVLVCVVILGLGGAAFLALASLKQPPAERPPVAKVYNVDVVDVARQTLPQVITSYGTAQPQRDVLYSAKVSGHVVTDSPLPIQLNVHGVTLFVGNQFGVRRTIPLLKVGQRVSPDGPLLLQIDPTMYRLKYEQAKLKVAADEREIALIKQRQANNETLLAQAELDLKTYREQYERLLRAKQDGAAVASQLTDAKLKLQNYATALTRTKNEQALFPIQLKQLANQKQQHEKERDLALQDLRDTQVSARFPGVISEVHVQPGEFVKTDDPLVRVTDDSIVEIPLPLAPEDFAIIAPRVRQAESEEELPLVRIAETEEAPYQWEGRVVRLAPRADEVTQTAKVYVRVDNRRAHRSPERVLPGIHYHGRIHGPPLTNVIAIPRDAIVWSDTTTAMAAGGEGYSSDTAETPAETQTEARVFIANNLKRKTQTTDGGRQPVWEGEATSRRVKLRKMLGPFAVVETGLKEGDRVILTNLDVIHEGARVRFPARRPMPADKTFE